MTWIMCIIRYYDATQVLDPVLFRNFERLCRAETSINKIVANPLSTISLKPIQKLQPPQIASHTSTVGKSKVVAKKMKATKKLG
jgi:hypothetical protein